MCVWRELESEIIEFLLTCGFSSSPTSNFYQYFPSHSELFPKKNKSQPSVVWLLDYSEKEELVEDEEDNEIVISILRNIGPNSLLFHYSSENLLFEIIYLTKNEEIKSVKIDSDNFPVNEVPLSKDLWSNYSFFSVYSTDSCKKLEKSLIQLENRWLQCILGSALHFSSIISSEKNNIDDQDLMKIFGKSGFFYYLIRPNLEKISKKFSKMFSTSYSGWKKDFLEIYHHDNLHKDLFFDHSYFISILKTMQFTGLNRQNPGEIGNQIFNLENYAKTIAKSNIETNLSLDEGYFGWIFKNLEIFDLLYSWIPRFSYQRKDLLSLLYMDLITIHTRHSSGEVYTPEPLIELMVNAKYHDQNSCMDPSCGSGGFLVILLRKISKKPEPHNRPQVDLYGIDKNPLAVETCITNFIMYRSNLHHTLPDIVNKNNNHKINLHVFLGDALFPDHRWVEKIKNNVELILGNPPWINLSTLYTHVQKQNVKELASDLKILLPMEAKNTEICTIFFFRCAELYLKEYGEIFFVLPASVLNGHQYVYFRYFYQFDNIGIWKFDTDLFKIYSICLYARKNSGIGKIEEKDCDIDSFKLRLTIPETIYHVKRKKRSEIIDHFIEKELYSVQPLYVRFGDHKHPFPMIGRYNREDKDDVSSNIQARKSYYYSKVKGGIRIVPRRWVVVKEIPPFENVVEIHPDMKQQSKPKWANPPYQNFKIESCYIQAFLKSKALIPYSFVQCEYAYIPFIHEVQNLSDISEWSLNSLKPLAQEFHKSVDTAFRANIKPGASMKNLVDNFTFNNRLVPSTYYFSGEKKYLVVHNSIGSIVKSTIVRYPIILDNSLYFFLTDNENEAYYLMGILNSSIMTKLVKRIGSTGSRGSLRNIHKNPYNFPVPKFQNEELFMKVVNLSKSLESFVMAYLSGKIPFEKEHILKMDWKFFATTVKIRTRKIQNDLLKEKKYLSLQSKMDKYVLELMNVKE